MGIPMPVESVVHEVDLSDEWAALSQQLETAMQEETAAAVQESRAAATRRPGPRACLDSRRKRRNCRPKRPLRRQPSTSNCSPWRLSEVAESETLAADSLIADLAGDLESITSSLGISAGARASRADCGKFRASRLPRKAA